MKIVNTSTYSEFKLYDDDKEIAEVTYPNYVQERAIIHFGDSTISIRQKFSLMKLLMLAVFRSKTFTITKDNISRGSFEVGHRDVIKINWENSQDEQLDFYFIQKEKTKDADLSLSLYDADNTLLMVSYYWLVLRDLSDEVELEVYPSDLEQEKLYELALYFIQATKIQYNSEEDF